MFILAYIFCYLTNTLATKERTILYFCAYAYFDIAINFMNFLVYKFCIKLEKKDGK